MKQRKGLTLIEVIITIAIISIMAVVILSIFNTSIISIFKSGNRTDKVFEVKKEIDQKIIDNESNTTGIDEVTVIIPGIGDKTIKGTMIKNTEHNDLNITTFVPNKADSSSP